MNVEGVTDHDKDFLDLEFDKIKSKPLGEIHWFEYERDDIDVRAITMIQRTIHWLSRMRRLDAQSSESQMIKQAIF